MKKLGHDLLAGERQILHTSSKQGPKGTTGNCCIDISCKFLRESWSSPKVHIWAPEGEGTDWEQSGCHSCLANLIAFCFVSMEKTMGNTCLDFNKSYIVGVEHCTLDGRKLDG